MKAPARAMHPHRDRDSGAPRASAAWAAESPSHAISSSTSRSAGRRRSSAACADKRASTTSAGSSGDSADSRTRRSVSASARLRERRSFARTSSPLPGAKEGGIRNHIESSPGHGERLGHDLLGGIHIAATSGVGQHGVGVLPEQGLETEEGVRARCLIWSAGFHTPPQDSIDLYKTHVRERPRISRSHARRLRVAGAVPAEGAHARSGAGIVLIFPRPSGRPHRTRRTPRRRARRLPVERWHRRDPGTGCSPLCGTGPNGGGCRARRGTPRQGDRR